MEPFNSEGVKVSDCIIWKGCLNSKGYGNRTVNRVNVLAHRYAYAEVFGRIPPGMIIMHTCDNRACINPKHLVAGTLKENMQDAKRKGRKIGAPKRWSPRRDSMRLMIPR